MSVPDKLHWSGRVVSIQPRVRLIRSFDHRRFEYGGFVLAIEGDDAGEDEPLRVTLGRATQRRHRVRFGDVVSGASVRVPDEKREVAAWYRTTEFAVHERGPEPSRSGPPWLGVPLSPAGYRARGHRRLSARTYHESCRACLWGALMPVAIRLDPWDASRVRHRTETFCYGPLLCPTYRPGQRRRIFGPAGAVLEPEEVDVRATSHRRPSD